jgi:IMP dehydrogenase
MSKNNENKLGFSYDDMLLKPGYSEILPSEAELVSKFSRNIPLNMPIVSAAMDTVTESRVAIVMAQEGGIGVIHKNLSPEDHANEVRKVKKYEAGIIVVDLTAKHGISGVPVVDEDNRLEGILTSRDMQFEENLSLRVREVMTPKSKLVTVTENVNMAEARQLLHRHRIEKLPVVDEQGRLKGLITIRDITKIIHFPNSNKDSLGRLRVAAAVGVGEKEKQRVVLLVAAGVDAIVVDTAHGHSKGVIEMVKWIRIKAPKIDIVAGNVATAKACEDLIAAGVDGIKVGIGPGSICTTRVVAGVGMPQLSAVMECATVCNKEKIPFIADGGIKYSGDIVKALAAGASSVMIGSLFAGTDESPGERILYQGRTFKVYRGMGSLGAMKLGSKDRYGQGQVEEIKKLVPEGIEGQVPYRGSLVSSIYQLLGGLRAGMGYVGAKNLTQLQEMANFIQITPAALKESHPHDVMITKEAPNYYLS